MWFGEVEGMRTRIETMRKTLHDQLAVLRPESDFSFLIKQKGMFSYTGFSQHQVETLRNEHAIYLINSGRMCLAGLNEHNVERVAKAFAAL